MAARTAPQPIGQQLLLDGLAAFAKDCESALPAEDFEWGWERDVKTAREQLLAAEALQWSEAEGLRMGALAAYVAMSIATQLYRPPDQEISTDIDSKDELCSELGEESDFENFNGGIAVDATTSVP